MEENRVLSMIRLARKMSKISIEKCKKSKHEQKIIT